MYSCIYRMNQDSFLDPFANSSIKSDESEEYDPRNDLLAIEQINNGRPTYEDPSSTSLETLFANVFDPSLSEQVISTLNEHQERHQVPGPSSNQNLGVQIIPAEVAKNPPPAYENVVSTDQGSPMSDCSHSSRISGELIPSTSKPSTKNRHYRGGRIRSGPYEKYKDESGKIKVEEIADPIERERVLEKREKNRVAAEKARQKKRERIDELEREKKRLEELIAASDLDAVRIQRNLDYLRVSFQEHEKVCCFKK